MTVADDGRWVDAGPVDSLPAGSAARVDVAGAPVCVANVRGDLYAIGDGCTHESAQLSDGTVWEDTCEIECPMHDSPFNLRTGEPSNPPATAAVAVYRCRVQNGRIQVSA